MLFDQTNVTHLMVPNTVPYMVYEDEASPRVSYKYYEYDYAFRDD